jgi:hypothetical protein
MFEYFVLRPICAYFLLRSDVYVLVRPAYDANVVVARFVAKPGAIGEANQLAARYDEIERRNSSASGHWQILSTSVAHCLVFPEKAASAN